MSPRAACRLERLGFERVYDYVTGKADWKAAGLPLEGTFTAHQVVADATRPDVPTCQQDESIKAVRDRTLAADWDECLVLDCDGIVVGRLRGEAWNQLDDSRAADVMESGPTTVRPDGLLKPLVQRMNDKGTALVIVTTPQGQLLGVVRRDEAQRVVQGDPPEQIWVDCDSCPGHWASKPD